MSVLHAWEYKPAVGCGTIQKSIPSGPRLLFSPPLLSSEVSRRMNAAWVKTRRFWGRSRNQGDAPDTARIAASTGTGMDQQHPVHFCPPLLCESQSRCCCWGRQAPQLPGKCTGKISSTSEVSLIRVVQALQEQPGLLEASPELSWHKRCLVWKRNVDLTNIANRRGKGKKKKKKRSLLIAPDYCIIFRVAFLQVWK